MKNAIFWRLVWKEYRLQQALWIAMLLLTVVIMIPVLVFVQQGDDRLQALYWIALSVPAFYALGCGASLFAGEREAETYEFQRFFPVTGGQVFWGKIVFALASLVCMFILTWTFATCLSLGNMPSPEKCGMMWMSMGFFGLELLFWATLFSLLSKRVLGAAILGVMIPSIIMQATIPMLAWTPERLLYTSPTRFLIFALLFVVDAWLGYRWFRQRMEPFTTKASTKKQNGKEQSLLSVEIAAGYLKPKGQVMFRRLVWQHWRQSRKMLLIDGILLLPLILFLYEEMSRHFRHYASLLTDPANSVFFTLALVLAGISIPLMGVCAFLTDQQRSRYHFFADRGISPKYLWWSRQVLAIILPFSILGSLCTCGVLAVIMYESFYPCRSLNIPLLIQSSIPITSHISYYALIFLHLILFIFFALSIGQFCSMLIRSSFLAGFAGVLLSALALGWCGLMTLWQFNGLWSIMPIPIALLVATRLRTADWLIERRSPRTWLLPGMTVALPILTLCIITSFYRAYEFPDVDPGFSMETLDRPMTPKEKATYELYVQASRAVKPLPARSEQPQTEGTPQKNNNADEEWVKANQEAIALALKATEGTLYVPASQVVNQVSSFQILIHLLMTSGTLDTKKGKLDDAATKYLAALKLSSLCTQYGTKWYYWNHYEYQYWIDWSIQPGQTPERIHAAIEKLQAIPFVLCYMPLLHHYLEVRTGFHSLGDFCHAWDIKDYSTLPPPTIIWFHLPWERQRAIRLLNIKIERELKEMNSTMKRARCREKIWDPEWILVPKNAQIPDPPYGLHYDINIPPFSNEMYCTAEDQWGGNFLTRAETKRRVTCLLLALQAWRLEHGSLPETQEELVGPYLKEIPIDPCSGWPFFYHPKGIDVDFDGYSPDERQSKKESPRFPSHTPLVISFGYSRYYFQNPPIDDQLYLRALKTGKPESLLQHCWPFRIPDAPSKP